MSEMLQPSNIEIVDKISNQTIENCRKCKVPETGTYIKTSKGNRKVVERLIKLNNDVVIWVM